MVWLLTQDGTGSGKRDSEGAVIDPDLHAPDSSLGSKVFERTAECDLAVAEDGDVGAEAFHKVQLVGR